MFSLLILRFTDTNKPLPLLRGRHNHHANRNREGTRKRRSTDESFVETLVVADRTMVDAFKSKADLQAYILTLMGVVRSLRKLLNPTGQNKMEQHAFIPPKIKHVAFKRAMIFPSLILGVSAGSTFFRPFCTGLKFSLATEAKLSFNLCCKQLRMKHKHKYKQKRINCSFSWACVGLPLFTLHKTLVFGIVLASPSCLNGKRPSCVGAGFHLTQHPFSGLVLVLCFP